MESVSQFHSVTCNDCWGGADIEHIAMQCFKPNVSQDQMLPDRDIEKTREQGLPAFHAIGQASRKILSSLNLFQINWYIAQSRQNAKSEFFDGRGWQVNWIRGELRHAEYIASWISLLKEDDRAIFTAASKASQAANLLRAFSGEVKESE
jgi:Zincin-like metallopeptidase